MSFRNIVISIALTCLFLTFSGCSNVNDNTVDRGTNYDKYDPALDEEIQNAKTVFDLKQYLPLSSDGVIYNEYPGAADDLAMYFSLIDQESYIVVESGNEKYILFKYTYSSYNEQLSSISNVKKTYEIYNNYVLHVNVDYEVKSFKNRGDWPHISVAYCILKLDEDIDRLYVEHNKYDKFDGGLIYLNERYGVVNDNYDIIVPIKYFTIRDFENFSRKTTDYLFMRTEDGVGLMDTNYNVLIQPSYDTLEYVSDNRFIAQKDTDRDINTPEDSQLSIIDLDENVLFGPIDGYIEYVNNFNNPVHQLIIGRVEDDKMYKGVIDDQLNVIIDTIYTDVADFEIDDSDLFYVVEKENGETT